MSHEVAVKRKLFWKAYDGAPLHDDMPGDIGQYVMVDVGDHDLTRNSSCWGIFRKVCKVIQEISVHESFLQPVSRPLVKAALKGIDEVVWLTRQMRVTLADDTVEYPHGGGPRFAWEPPPVLFPLNTEWGLLIASAFLGAGYQCPRLVSNRYDYGILSCDARAIYWALAKLKERMMIRLFQVEPKGRVDPDELTALFNGLELRPPMMDLGIEDVLTDTSADRPSSAGIEDAEEGKDVFRWKPKKPDWALFAMRYEQELGAGPEMLPEQPSDLSADGEVRSTGAATKRTSRRNT